MRKQLLGLRYWAAVAAMLYASVLVHALHPLYHALPARNTAMAMGAARASLIGTKVSVPVCTCAACGAAASTPAARLATADCPICKFLLHQSPQNLSAGTSWVSYEVAREKTAELDLAVHVSYAFSSANARAPPSCTLAATSA